MVKMLAEAEEHYRKVLEMLKVIPIHLEEYSQLLDREGKLARLIQQLKLKRG